ncbi:MAG: hypothetical protein AB1695_04600 [Stygiobacter sp.]
MKFFKGIFYKLVIFLFVITALLFQACSATISLSRSPSDLVLVMIKPNNNDNVLYSVDSKIVEPFEYKNSAGYSFYFPINSAFRNNIDTYMQTKFSKILNTQTKNDSTFSVKYELRNFEIAYDLEQNTGEVLSSLFGKGGTQGNAIVDVKLTVFVNVSKNGKTISEKNIISTSKYSEYLQYGVKIESIYEKAVNDGISKCIIMIDKYLVSVNL